MSSYIDSSMTLSLGSARTFVTKNLPGTLVCGVIALAATFVSEHYGGPQLLYALLMGLAFHFLSKNVQVGPGVGFCGRTVLRGGVALLGARITLTQVGKLGWSTGLLIMMGLAGTIFCGYLLSRWLKRPAAEGVLSGGAVAICGASAALAVSSVLPQSKENDRFTLLTVVGVTVLSTVAMVIYPFGLKLIGATPSQSGIFLGGTIHDVAQVVAAGMLLGPEAGDTATVVKLFRVMLLMPAVVIISLLFQRQTLAQDAKNERQDHVEGTVFVVNTEKKTKKTSVPLIPTFMLAFIVLVLLSSVGVLSPSVIAIASDTSRWMLVTAIAAAGVKTSFEELMTLGWKPVVMLVGETVFIALFVLTGIFLFGIGKI